MSQRVLAVIACLRHGCVICKKVGGCPAVSGRKGSGLRVLLHSTRAEAQCHLGEGIVCRKETTSAAA